MRPAIVGEAPGPNTGTVPFVGQTGRRLAELAGMDLAHLRERVLLLNLLPTWPGPQARHHERGGKGSRFPLRDARRSAAILWPALSGRVVLLCGVRVATAFGLRGVGFFTWATADDGTCLAVVPHPSGVSRWWNDAAARRRAAAFLRNALVPVHEELLDAPRAAA